MGRQTLIDHLQPVETTRQPALVPESWHMASRQLDIAALFCLGLLPIFAFAMIGIRNGMLLSRDCDAKSLLPVAVTGLALIDGYAPPQPDCVQDAAWVGFPPPPLQPVVVDRITGCIRAVSLGFGRLAWLDEAGLDVVDCRPES